MIRGGGIINVVDEIFSAVPNAGELSISWQMFGSNGHETADYSRGVLERFTRREPNTASGTCGCKPIVNPRRVKHMESPHWAALFEEFIPVTEDKKFKTCVRWILEPPFTDKIVVNHYHCKSWEEYSQRAPRGDNNRLDGSKYSRKFFEERDHNEEFDDGILKYREERAKIYQPPDKSRADEKLFVALTENLLPTFLPNSPPKFYKGKMETFLTCRAVAAYLKTKLADKTGEFFEEAALKAILRTVVIGAGLAEIRLLIKELPILLALPYPVVKDIRNVALQIIPQVMEILHFNNLWRDFVELDYLTEILRREEFD